MNFYTDNMDIKLIDIDKEYEYPLKCALGGLPPDYSMFKNQLKKIQRNAIEYALKVASENAVADINITDIDAATDYNRMLETYENPIEVYVINSSITGLKDKIFKLNDL